MHESLLSAGVIEHPYYGDTEAAVRWVEDRTWWFRTTFDAPESGGHDRAILRFHGLDGVATVWLNGTELGTHANQHRPADFDVTALVRTSNEVLLRFSPPLQGLITDAELDAAVEDLLRTHRRVRPDAADPDRERLAIRLLRARRRKATFSWGWDFAPRIPSIGLHRPAELVHVSGPVFAGVHARTAELDLDRRTAEVLVDVEVDETLGRAEAVRATLTSPHGDAVSTEAPAAQRVSLLLTVSDVLAWWTHDLGDQPLYELRTELLAHGAPVDVRVERIGIRTIALDRSADEEEGGRLFRFVLNGTPVFARGANWVPPSQLVGSVPDATYQGLVDLARRGSMNMLRVWGGGIYEPDVFFDACDRLGVLVWQDFMFACDDYPSEDPELRREVGLEAEFQVRRLRNHPSLALWAGNNEVQLLHEFATGGVEPGNWGWSFFHEDLPSVVQRESPGALYWPGSPWGEAPGESVNGVTDGDRHAWEVWHGIDVGAGGPTDYASRAEALHFRRYAYDTGRFISEFGIHASPELATLQRWLPAADLRLDSATFALHNKDTPPDKGWLLMEVETGRPESLPQYVDFSMACQAEGLKYGVEHYRRRQPHCSGTLVWQFNDPWPGLSWSVVDHDLRPKAAYWFLQRAYRPVIATFRVAGDVLELWVTNSGSVAADVALTVEVGPVDGRAAEIGAVKVVSAPMSSEVVWRGDVPPADAVAWVSSADDAVVANRAFFAPLKALPLTGSVEAVATRTSDTSAVVELTSTGYSYLTRVLAPTAATRFDTNYLDLRDGDRQVVTVTGLPAGTELHELTVASYGHASRPVSVR